MASEQNAERNINGLANAAHPLWEPDPALKNRTRFFVDLAVEHGPRLSALVFLVAIHTNRKHRMGRPGRRAAWHQSAAWYGHQLGISAVQVRRLMRQGRELNLVNYDRSGRGYLAWVKGKRVWKWLDAHYAGDHGEREYVVGHYDTELAKHLGIVAACILDLLERPTIRNNEIALKQLRRMADRLSLDEHGVTKLIREAGHSEAHKLPTKRQVERDKEYRHLDYKSISYRLPWISEREADFELLRLHRLGLIQRRRLGEATAYSRGCLWEYYSPKCLQKLLA
jgi:hypothetical protein